MLPAVLGFYLSQRVFSFTRTPTSQVVKRLLKQQMETLNMVCACDLKYMLLPGSRKVTYPWVCKRWWDITRYWWWKADDGEERCCCCHHGFFFLKHWNTIPKLWWSLPIPAAGWTVFYIHLQQWYGFVAAWKQCLSDACKLCCAYTVCCSSEYRGPWLAKQFQKEDSSASELRVRAWGSDLGHLYNVNKFLCDFQTHVLLSCYTYLTAQNKTNTKEQERWC